MPKYDYIIYHKRCLDGFTSFIILLKSGQIDENAKIVPDVPSATQPPKNIDDKNIIIMDVAYTPKVLKQIVERARNVIFIDHHITSHSEIELLEKQYSHKLKVIYNIAECGASLTWKFFFGDKKMPLFIKYIKDNDIGEWKLKHTKPFIYCLRVKYDINHDRETLDKWMNLFDKKNVKKIIKRGKIYEEYATHLVDENVKKYTLRKFPSELIYDKFTKYFNKPAEFTVAVFCGSGCPNASVLGNKAIDVINCDFAIIWTYNMEKKEYVLSFRSKSANVSQIASIFGGGGHIYASACSFKASDYCMEDLFTNEVLPRT
jgi:oligoribonuclease NrnB/cAMP/cGMP phosphodiesterase (DHH superfamily)